MPTLSDRILEQVRDWIDSDGWLDYENARKAVERVLAETPAVDPLHPVRQALYWMDRAFQHICTQENCPKCRAKKEAEDALKA